MFFVDLDNFKTVNDTYGHATGDALIQQVGQRLVETVRSQDTVARLGGDEFAILLPGLVDQLAINQLAERTLDAMHTPFDIFGEQVSTSASVGIAIAPEHGDSYDDLLNRADEAMFRAKDHGRNAFEMFHHSPDPAHPGRRAVDDRQLYNDLISALDGNEFFLVYQPYIDLRTAQIVGVEALIRWDHPTLGILEPSQFIPMAEKSDLIISLDNWVLWQACRQLRAWQDHDLDQLRLSVNLASRDLASPTFYDSVERTLRDTGIEPSLLELDITDRVVLDASGPAKDNIDRLRRLGVRFTIDDFGQGNSSLDRIGSFPVSTLKIDQSFVQVLGAERRGGQPGLGHHRHGQPARPVLRGRGGGDPPAEPGAPPAGLHHRPGLLLQPAAAARGDRGDARQPVPGRGARTRSGTRPTAASHRSSRPT